MKILIADSGSTKTHWCLVDEGGAELHFSSEGYNPNYLTREYLVDSLHCRSRISISTVPDVRLTAMTLCVRR